MKAIQTKYLPATNTKGSRIKAFTNDFNVTIPFDYSLNDEQVYFKAVKELVKKYKLDWDISKMNYGSIKDGYVFCFNDSIITDYPKSLNLSSFK